MYDTILREVLCQSSLYHYFATYTTRDVAESRQWLVLGRGIEAMTGGVDLRKGRNRNDTSLHARTRHTLRHTDRAKNNGGSGTGEWEN